MKKFFFCTLVLLFTTVCFGQVRYGIKGGLNIANEELSASQGGATASESGNSIPSFHIGGFAEIPISPNYSFVPEILLSGKGSDFPGTDNLGNSTTVSFRPYYLDIPLDFVYNKKIQGGATFFIGAGPEFSIGLFGKLTDDDSTANIFQAGGLKNFDVAINLISGVELKSGVRLSINYAIGVTSALNEQGGNPDGAGFYNRVFGFSVGYAFNKNK
jgi:hypothetical protein